MNAKLKNAASVLSAICQARILHRRIPLVVSWTVTYRCNSRCRYCDLPNRAGDELELPQIYSIIEILARRGCRFFSLTGGEPLLRQDIGMIVDFARLHGLSIARPWPENYPLYTL